MNTLEETYRALTLDIATHMTELQAVKQPKPDVFDEEVNGMIIECGPWVTWKLYHGDKPVGSNLRGGMQHSDTQEEALEIAREMIKEALEVAQICFPGRYNDKSQWHIRIY